MKCRIKDVGQLTKAGSFIRRISLIKTGYVATFTVIANDAFSCTEAFARFACALRALIVAGASCNNCTQVSFNHLLFRS